MEEEKGKGNAKLNLKSITEQQTYIHDFICLLCKQVANNPMEINNCLNQFLSQNTNPCPVEPHNNCSYSQGRLVKRYINELDVICPRQFQHEQEQVQLQMPTQRGHEEGEIPVIVIFDFKGKVKQMMIIWNILVVYRLLNVGLIHLDAITHV
ncbi:hypothetical protein RFI_01197 [Reticulomyxa filosa]|uniref:Uncharacterized protein n=1 Tax=Reticulomyxa filosa TaxID=46433 RepID=X6PCH8_RETFI|nr:hypothetical protein RFI_01197 [Reticulomyxa filosa]|eukprot:ETO35866.1 hypothetical protein RFI_01197 [Reticulomyxa filosa]